MKVELNKNKTRFIVRDGNKKFAVPVDRVLEKRNIDPDKVKPVQLAVSDGTIWFRLRRKGGYRKEGVDPFSVAYNNLPSPVMAWVDYDELLELSV